MARGNEAQIRAELSNACARDQLHGAYLIEGGPGTGKLEIATWLARLALCKNPGVDPCGTCHGCRLLSSAAGAGEDGRPLHPDLKWVEPDGAYVKVDQIRGLQRELSLVANEGGRRVGLILGAEKLRVEASNALLKTLEEPPAATVLILVADSSEGLPRTLRSRTLRLRLTPVPEPEVRAELEAEGVDPIDAWLAAALGGGSADAARAWSEANLDDARQIHDFLDGIAGGGATEILDFAEGFRGGEPARRRATLLLGVHAALTRRQAEAAARGSDSAGIARWLDRFEAGQKAQRELQRRNLNPQLVVEGLLMDLRAMAS